MRVGLVSKWFASGQGVITRQIRSALEELGHQTFVLARPGRGPRALKRDGVAETADPVWIQPEVTEASVHEIPAEEYGEWAARNQLDAILFDENYQFDEIARLRRQGLLTIGRFVWESFASADVPGAREAFDVVYSLTRCERRRYAELGIDTPLVRWGIHPALLEAGLSPATLARADTGTVRFLLPGGFFGPRKPADEVLAAFASVRNERLRLTVSGQLPRRERQLRAAARRDPRVELVLEDLQTADYLGLMARADVLLVPSRWEGLGMPLYEGTAFGLPIITTDAPPMNEVVIDGLNGALVPSTPSEVLRSGIRARDVTAADLGLAIERLADDRERGRLTAGARERRAELDWDLTVAGLASLLEV